MKIKISLPNQIIIAAILGITTGVLFGEQSVIFDPFGQLYIMLLQAVVYPYIISTLIFNLGQLTPGFAKKLFRKGRVYYVGLVLLSFVIILIISIAIPKIIASIHSIGTSTLNHVSLFNMLVPSNIVAALSYNYVPAVILFCVFFGIMLQHVKQKQSFLNFLDTISCTSLVFWKWLVKFAPIGTYALLANLAGTINLTQIHAFSEYIILFIIGSLILTFWLLPMIICSLTGIKYRELMAGLKEALVLSAATTLSVVALPYIINFIKKLIEHKPIDKEESEEVMKTTLMISYPFAQVGNFFIYLFIIFALLYFDTEINQHQKLLLPFISYLTSIGSPSTTVNSIEFLSQWLNLPNDTTQLYISSTTITRYLQVILSVMSFSFITILTTYAYYGFLKKDYKKLMLNLILGLLIVIGFTYALNYYSPDPAIKKYQHMLSLTLPKELTESVTVLPNSQKQKISEKLKRSDAFHRIIETGTLRVGYNPNMMPFSYLNNEGELVGYDVMFAYRIAKNFNANIVFVPYQLENIIKDIKSNKFDIAIGGLIFTPERLLHVNYTRSYFKTPYVFIVKNEKLKKFESANTTNLRIAVENDPVYIKYVKRNFPNSKLIITEDFQKSLDNTELQENIDAALWIRVQAYFWVLENKGYTLIPTDSKQTEVPLAYMVPKNSPLFLNYLNYYMQYERVQGRQKELFDKWIYGLSNSNNQKRWSILDYLSK